MPLGPDGLEGFISISSFVTQPVSACNVHLDRKHLGVWRFVVTDWICLCRILYICFLCTVSVSNARLVLVQRYLALMYRQKVFASRMV